MVSSVPALLIPGLVYYKALTMMVKTAKQLLEILHSDSYDIGISCVYTFYFSREHMWEIVTNLCFLLLKVGP